MVKGKRPDGFTSPYRISTRLLPLSSPGRLAQTMAVTLGFSTHYLSNASLKKSYFLHIDLTDRMDDDYCVGTISCDSSHKIIATSPSSQVLPITLVAVNGDITFSGICFQESEANRSLFCSIRNEWKIKVIQQPLNDRAVLSCAGLQSFKRRYEMRKLG
jgi:hypothetical protein